MTKIKYYNCKSNISTATGRMLNSCVVRCKDRLKNCWRSEKEQNGVIYVYPEDRRSWFQKHRGGIFFTIISFGGACLIQIFI